MTEFEKLARGLINIHTMSRIDLIKFFEANYIAKSKIEALKESVEESVHTHYTAGEVYEMLEELLK